jgi:hypothetical protein
MAELALMLLIQLPQLHPSESYVSEAFIRRPNPQSQEALRLDVYSYFSSSGGLFD